MANDERKTPRDAQNETDFPFRNPDGALNGAFLETLEDAVATKDAARLKELAGDLHESDLGDVLEALPPESRAPFIELLGDDFDFAALTEIDEAIRRAIIEALPAQAVAEGVRELESDDAVYILEDLDRAEQAEILAALPIPERLALERGLDYPEESAGRRMQTDFIAIPAFWTVGQTIDHLRESRDLPDSFYEIYIIDPAFRLQGAVALNRLLRAPRPTVMHSLMHEERRCVGARDDQEDVARLFERYNLVSVAVVDEAERLVGVITVDDIVDVIKEEAEEDIRALAGVGDEELSDSVLYTVRTRSVWLILNLATAFLASNVIGLFGGAIEKMVALAILMPIVASMGGNAGTQTMTVTVRALATHELDRHNARRMILREMATGFVNGLIFAFIVAFIAGLWFQDPALAMIIAAAMIITLLAAALAGIFIPLTLNRLRIDPAVASSVFVTAVTDVVGFFAFLGLATWILIA